MKTRFWIYAALFLFGLSFWEFVTDHNDTVRLLLSSPSLSYHYFTSNSSNLIASTSVTLLESLAGLLIAVLFSFAAMILCLRFPKLMELVLPLMVSSQVVPLITLAPLFIILFGIGLAGKIAMAGLMCFFPIFVNFSTGVRMISKNIHDLMYVYNASKTFQVFGVYFPLSLPHIMTGIKISSSLAVIGAIVAEFSGADMGLGKNLFLAAKRLEPELMMCSLFLSTALGSSLYLLILGIERKIGKWYIH